MNANGQTVEMLIREHPFFVSMRPEQVKFAAEDAEIKEFEAGEILFREGEPANRLFLIESGKVVLETWIPRGGKMAIETLGSGDVAGWSWLIPPFSWRFQARVAEAARIIVLNGARLLVAAEDNPEFGYALMRRVSQVMAHRMEALRRQVFEEREQNPLWR